MNLGARTAMWSGGAKPWVNPFSTQDLLFHISGLWNAGYGVHNDIVDNWFNLATGEYCEQSYRLTFGDNFCNYVMSLDPYVTIRLKCGLRLDPTIPNTVIIYHYGPYGSIQSYLGDNPKFNIHNYISADADCISVNGFESDSFQNAVYYYWERTYNRATANVVTPNKEGSYDCKMYNKGLMVKRRDAVGSVSSGDISDNIRLRQLNYTWATKLYDLRIYGRAMSAEEISEDYEIFKSVYGDVLS